MTEKKYLFEDFASGFLKIDDFAYRIDEILSDIDPNRNYEEELKELISYYDSENDDGFITDEEAFSLALSCGKEVFTDYLNRYYDSALQYYRYWEYEHGGFGSAFSHFSLYLYYVLGLCAEYFDSINDKEKAGISCLLLMCNLSYDGDPTNDGILLPVYDAIENVFDSLKAFIEPDWLAVHPSVTWNIGKYYLGKENYDKAREFFSLGASLDYDGRQSIEPFIAVGKNQYELGMIYYKGLGVEADSEKALMYFESAADNAGEPTIPAIEDMRLDNLLPEEDGPFSGILNGYGRFNPHNTDLDVYYTKLNEEQAKKLKDAADSMLLREGELDFDDLRFLNNIYGYRLYDTEKAKETEEKIFSVIKSTPVEERNDNMDRLYVSRWKDEWKRSAVKPTVNSGSVPKNPKRGDTFYFGTFDGEPIEWKVLEVYNNGTFFVITKKIPFKMSYNGAIKWLNGDFLENVFSEDEKKYIVPQENNADGRRRGTTYIYLPAYRQIAELESVCPEEPIIETDLAKSMSKNTGFYEIGGFYIRPDGERSNYAAPYEVRGIRPSMDLYSELPESK